MFKKSLAIIAVALVLMLSLSFLCFAEPEDEETEPPAAEAVTEAQPSPEPAPQPEPQPEPVQTTAARNLSNDSSLAELTVVGKTEAGESIPVVLNPAFSPATRTYSLEVPFEVVSLEINAKAAHSAARVNIPSGYLRLDVGQNRSFVYVTAEDGTRRTYQINTVRNEEVVTETTTEVTTEATTEPTTAETTTESVTEPVDVAPAVNHGRLNMYYKLAIVFAAAGILLLIISVIMIRRRKASVMEDENEENID